MKSPLIPWTPQYLGTFIMTVYLFTEYSRFSLKVDKDCFLSFILYPFTQLTILQK